jgi:hypothetical protein
MSAKIGRNDPCPCGSGKKFKRCCGGLSLAPLPEALRCADCGRAFDPSETVIALDPEEFESLSDAELSELAEHVSTLSIVGMF